MGDPIIMDELKVRLKGDSSVTSRNEAAAWSVSQRMNKLFSHWTSQFDVPGTYKWSMDIAKREFASVLADLVAVMMVFRRQKNPAGWRGFNSD